MPKEGNLIVTFEPTHQDSALKEISMLLSEVKDKGDIIKAEEGVAELIVKDAKKAVRELSMLSKKSPDKFAFTSHWIPVEKWCKNAVADMQKEIKSLALGIKKNEKWKMDLKIRKLKERPDEIKLITKLTEVVDNQNVDLGNPDKIIKIEIIGSKAGLALLDKGEFLNLSKLKQKG
ncbi:MAG: THUMP domain-containing protein [archaeon]